MIDFLFGCVFMLIFTVFGIFGNALSICVLLRFISPRLRTNTKSTSIFSTNAQNQDAITIGTPTYYSSYSLSKQISGVQNSYNDVNNNLRLKPFRLTQKWLNRVGQKKISKYDNHQKLSNHVTEDNSPKRCSPVAEESSGFLQMNVDSVDLPNKSDLKNFEKLEKLEKIIHEKSKFTFSSVNNTVVSEAAKCQTSTDPIYNHSKAFKTPVLSTPVITSNSFIFNNTVGANMNTRKCQLYPILIMLACCDLLMLFVNFLVNFLAIGYRLTKSHYMYWLYLHQGYIIVSAWPLLISFQMLSVYLTLFVSYERWLAVCRPFNAYSASINQRRFKLRISSSVLITCVVLFNIPRWLEYRLAHRHVALQDIDWNYAMPSSLCQHGDRTQLYVNRNNISVWFTNASIFGLQNSDSVQEASCFKWPQYVAVEKSNFSQSIGYRYFYSSFLYALFSFLVPVSIITVFNWKLVRAVRCMRRSWLQTNSRQRHEAHLCLIPGIIVIMFYVLGLQNIIVNFFDAIQGQTIKFHRCSNVLSLSPILAMC